MATEKYKEGEQALEVADQEKFMVDASRKKFSIKEADRARGVCVSYRHTS